VARYHPRAEEIVSDDATATGALDERVTRLVAEYAQSRPEGPLHPRLTLRGDLAIDSLALVSMTIRLGEEFGVDIVESGVELGQLETVGDLAAIAQKLQGR
jgi:acyl carrier protein